MTTNPTLSKRVLAYLKKSGEAHQWEQLIGNLLSRLELDPTDRARAEADYKELAERVAKKLSLDLQEVHIFPQGSMRTQTTINRRYPLNFDLDLVVKLMGPKYDAADPEVMFAAFGKALEGNESVTGTPEKKRRCWRLGFPNKPYYFDLTPAVDDQTGKIGSSLSVRDPDTGWAPSNPEEFADWFCTNANQRFPFQTAILKSEVEARSTVTPLPDGKVALDDILRRAVQLMKLHRDTLYWGMSEDKKMVMPISVIIVTLATRAYADLLLRRPDEFNSPIEVVLAVVEAMPNYIERGRAGWRVENPELADENFADKWNVDNGARHGEFIRWHGKLASDLEALLHQSARRPSDDQLRSVFGNAGLEAWKASQPKSDVLNSLIASGLDATKTNPNRPVKMGSSNTLG